MFPTDLSNTFPEKPSTYQGDSATPFHSIEYANYTSFNTPLQDKKTRFSHFPARMPGFAESGKSRSDKSL